MISEILFLVEKIRSGRSKVDNFGTAVTVFLQPSAFEAVESVRYTLDFYVSDLFQQSHDPRTDLSATDDALILIVAERAFIADTNECGWSDIAIAHWTFSIAFVAKSPYCYARLLAAHY